MNIDTPQDNISCILGCLLQNHDSIYQSVSIALDIKHSLSGFLAIFHPTELFFFYSNSFIYLKSMFMLDIVFNATIKKIFEKIDHFYEDHSKPMKVWKINFYKSLSVWQIYVFMKDMFSKRIYHQLENPSIKFRLLLSICFV